MFTSKTTFTVNFNQTCRKTSWGEGDFQFLQNPIHFSNSANVFSPLISVVQYNLSFAKRCLLIGTVSQVSGVAHWSLVYFFYLFYCMLLTVPLENISLIEGLQNLGHCLAPTAFKGSLSCHTCCDTGHWFLWSFLKEHPNLVVFQDKILK